MKRIRFSFLLIGSLLLAMYASSSNSIQLADEFISASINGDASITKTFHYPHNELEVFPSNISSGNINIKVQSHTDFFIDFYQPLCSKRLSSASLQLLQPVIACKAYLFYNYPSHNFW